MASRAIFDIPLSGISMFKWSLNPTLTEMIKGSRLLIMTWRAECLVIMAGLALKFLPCGIDSMVPTVIQFMRKSSQIVIRVAVTAEILSVMAGIA